MRLALENIGRWIVIPISIALGYGINVYIVYSVIVKKFL